MIALKILSIALVILMVLFVLAYFFQPALLAFPYTAFISTFIKNPPYLDMEEHFPQHKLLRDNWHVIQEELEMVLAHEELVPKFHEIDSIQRFISEKDKVPWRTFLLKAYGKWVPSNAAKVPQTTALLEQLPQITTAMFSILDGGKHIPPHMGFFKGVLRYHLGLVVPTDAPCYILVGGKQYSWKEGEDVLFDDTYQHEVWNNSKNRRAILFCDLFREKDIPGWVQFLNRRMFLLLSSSNRLSKIIKKAEVTQEIGKPTLA